MNRKPKSLSFEKVVHEHIEAWRSRQAFIDDLLKESERQATQATKDPALGIEHLFVRVTGMRDSFERYLFSHYEFEAAGVGAEHIRDYLERSEHLPSSPEEWANFWVARIHWMVLEVAVIRMCDIVEADTSLGQETFRAMRKECYQCLSHLFGCLIAAYMLRTSYEKKQLDDLVSEEELLGYLTGWVGSQISLQRNERLNYALSKEGYSSFNQLLQELPATTLIELGNLVREEKHPSKLVSIVTRHLANGDSSTPELGRDEKFTDCDLADMNIVEPMLEEFVAREELEALRASSKLSEREDQVLDLMLEDRLDREIASELGITEGSVKTLKHRAREKLRKAAAQHPTSDPSKASFVLSTF